MNTTIHYLAGTNELTLCGVTREFRLANGNLISLWSRDVTCTACKTKIAELDRMGFVPKR